MTKRIFIVYGHHNTKKSFNQSIRDTFIDEAKKSKEINKIFVLTDSKKYQNIFLKMGVEVPFLRPKNISTDSSKDIESFYYFYKWLESNNKKIPDLFVHLRATAPLINYSKSPGAT